MDELKNSFDLDNMDFDFDGMDFDPFGESGEYSYENDSKFIKPKQQASIPDEKIYYKNARELVKSMNIRKNHNIYAIVNGSFVFGDFLHALITYYNLRLKELTISTLSMSFKNVDTLVHLMKHGFVKRMNLLVSTYFYSHERDNIIEYIYQKLGEYDFQLAVSRTHTKLILLHTEKDSKITIHGSSNLRSSDNTEQLQLIFDEELYNFNDKFHKKIINKYKTLKKPVRN